ncbi:MAG TPA: hypothetical protein DEB17_03660 [Chlorobaculum sp.]|uniref:Uncharacterized protein n=1 Tax=Chlorobaculum tepidum (strain ATCC 49652 / DSM 12025 / NBRC 103806 / TLS) TaxID=194439 RepID=Q8KDT9_CHLTE|nr:hypothetical protein CT0955 [Chlorobaculum tepidum TLS]HBU23081.1 hypothetical protein [Chlorobaculum sp.]
MDKSSIFFPVSHQEKTISPKQSQNKIMIITTYIDTIAETLFREYMLHKEIHNHLG